MSRLRTRPIAVAVLTAALTVSACSASTQGDPDDSSMSGAKLAKLLIRGSQSVKSAHMEMKVDVASISISAEGDEKIANGDATALRITEDVTSVGTMEMILVDKALYLKLPDNLNPSDKPWVRVSRDTTDSTMQKFVAVLDQIQYATSMDQYATYARATADVQNKGKQSVDGVSTDHYSLKVVVDNLPSDFPQLDAVKSAGIDSIPVELRVDAKGRTVKLTQNLEVSGQKTSTEVTMSAFDKPVTITAPPPAQVATP